MSITALPPELVEIIVADLEVQDIGNLRLTCRACEATASDGRFATFFRTQKLPLNVVKLKDFVNLTKQPGLLCRVKELQLIGEDHPEIKPEASGQRSEENSMGKLESLLLEAFNNLKRHAGVDALSSISFGVLGIPDNDDEPELNVHFQRPKKEYTFQQYREMTWRTATNAANVGLDALSKSGLHVHKLDIFSSVLCCSLSANDLWPLLKEFVDSPAATFVRHLALSVSHSPRETPKEQLVSIRLPKGWVDLPGIPKATDPKMRYKMSEITQTFDKLQKLEIFHLHWRCMYKSNNYHNNLPYPIYRPDASEREKEEESVLKYISSSSTWKTLKQCTLRGLYTTEEDLTNALEGTQLSSLTLEYMHLQPNDSFRPVFDGLTRLNTPLKEINMKYLHEGDNVICFPIPEYSRIHLDNLPVHCQRRFLSVKLADDSLKTRLIYTTTVPGRIPSQQAVYTWYDNLWFKYGPLLSNE